jgi:hypothetical protein
VAGPISSANREIREAERREHDRKLARLKLPRRLTDLLLSELEELNLEDVVQVPARLAPNLSELRDSLREWPEIESRYGARIRPGIRTSELIEIIFGIQEVLTPPQLAPDLQDEDDLLALPEEPGWPFERKP